MKKSEIKKLLKDAYRAEPSEKKSEFLRKYQLRELNYGQLLGRQLQYMGGQLAILGGCALAILLGAAVNMGEGFAYFAAALLPLAAMTAMTGLGRSERCGMSELEMASRFSLRMLRIMRLSIIGAVGLLLMLCASFAVRVITGIKLPAAFAFAALPYLLTTYLCTLLIRLWHSPRNLYGCAVIAVAVSAAAIGSREILLLFSGFLYAAAILFLFLTGFEACRYINESEKNVWNLC